MPNWSPACVRCSGHSKRIQVATLTGRHACVCRSLSSILHGRDAAVDIVQLRLCNCWIPRDVSSKQCFLNKDGNVFFLCVSVVCLCGGEIRMRVCARAIACFATFAD